MLVVLGLLACAVLAPVLAPYDPTAADLDRRLLPGFWDRAGVREGRFLLGTDDLGRDVLSRIIYGARISVAAGGSAVVSAGLVGVVLGVLAGFYGGALDELVMRAMDILLAFPALLLAIAIVAALGPDLVNAVIAIALVNIPSVARVVRASTLSVKNLEYFDAARALGASPLRILWRHLMPNIVGTIAVYLSLVVGRVILWLAALGFLGLGTRPPSPEWGTMLSESRNYILVGAWWVALFPGLAIVVVVLGLNLLGDGLRDVLDPRFQ